MWTLYLLTMYTKYNIDQDNIAVIVLKGMGPLNICGLHEHIFITFFDKSVQNVCFFSNKTFFAISIMLLLPPYEYYRREPPCRTL